MSRLTFQFSLDTTNLINEVNAVVDDPYVRRDVHRLLAEMCDKYVPYDTGALSGRGTYYGADGVHYGVGLPYAHYVYEGIVYGPNFQYVDKKGAIKWASPKGKPKSPNPPDMQPMNYTKSGHPDATGHWDKEMLAREGDVFREKVEQIMQRRLKKLNG